MVYDPTPWDDIEGLGDTQVKGVRQFTFGLEPGGPVYEIVLGERHSSELEKAFGRYITHARETGLKMPHLPAGLRAEFPDVPASAELSLLPPPVPPRRSAPATRKPPVPPLRDEEIPPRFWVTPKDADNQTAVAYTTFRKRIYQDMGKQARQGTFPKALAFDWARKHPDALRAWVDAHPEIQMAAA